MAWDSCRNPCHLGCVEIELSAKSFIASWMLRLKKTGGKEKVRTRARGDDSGKELPA